MPAFRRSRSARESRARADDSTVFRSRSARAGDVLTRLVAVFRSRLRRFGLLHIALRARRELRILIQRAAIGVGCVAEIDQRQQRERWRDDAEPDGSADTR